VYRLLNMRSIPDEDDRTSRARIRDAAISCFAERGVAATTVRIIAAEAGVSPGLVIHHFGSKDGLRVACDQWVARRILEVKSDAIDQGLAMSPLGTLRLLEDGPPIMGYLARTLVDGSPHVADLVDSLVANGVAMSQQSVASGLMNATNDEHARAVVITIWSLGALVLHEHLERLLGENLLGDLESSPTYLRAVVDILSNPPLAAETGEVLAAMFEPSPPEPSPPEPSPPGRKDLT